LTEGTAEGTIPPECIRSARDFKERKFLYQAPIEYILVFNFAATCEDSKGPQTLKQQEVIDFPLVIIDVAQQKIIGST
jgi:hypothetical protein